MISPAVIVAFSQELHKLAADRMTKKLRLLEQLSSRTHAEQHALDFIRRVRLDPTQTLTRRAIFSRGREYTKQLPGGVSNGLTNMAKAMHEKDVSRAVSGRHLARKHEVVLPTALTAERLLHPEAASKKYLFRGKKPKSGKDPNIFLSKHPDVSAGYSLGTDFGSMPQTLRHHRERENLGKNKTFFAAYRQKKTPMLRDQAAGLPHEVTDHAAVRARAHPLARKDLGDGASNPTYETLVDSRKLPKPAGVYQTRLVRTKDMKPAVALSHVSGEPAWVTTGAKATHQNKLHYYAHAYPPGFK